MKSSQLLSALILVCLPFLASCYFTSAHPLPPAAAVDPALLGLWQSIPASDAEKGETGFLLFTALDNRVWITIFEEPYRADEMYLGYCSEIRGEKYLSLQLSKPDRDATSMSTENDFLLVHYVLGPKGQLTVTLLNNDFFKSAVMKNRLEGTLAKDDLRLTASSTSMASFLNRSKIKELLDDERLLTAVKIQIPNAPADIPPTP